MSAVFYAMWRLQDLRTSTLGLNVITCRRRPWSAVRKSNLFIIRMTKIAEKFCRLNLPWAIGAPTVDGPSIFDMPEVRKLLSLNGVISVRIGLASWLGNLDFNCAGDRVDENIVNYSRSARCRFSSKFWDHWAFPILRTLAGKISPSCPVKQEPTEPPMSSVVQHMSSTDKLRGQRVNAKEAKQDEDRRSLCGLRNTSEVISRLSGHLKLGNILCEFFHKTLRGNPHLRKLLVSLGSGIIPVDEIDTARTELDNLVEPVRLTLSKILQCTHSGPVDNDVCDTDIRAELLRRWATAARDPGAGVCDWLTQGAYAGMCADPEGVDGIFPPC